MAVNNIGSPFLVFSILYGYSPPQAIPRGVFPRWMKRDEKTKEWSEEKGRWAGPWITNIPILSSFVLVLLSYFEQEDERRKKGSVGYPAVARRYTISQNLIIRNQPTQTLEKGRVLGLVRDEWWDFGILHGPFSPRTGFCLMIEKWRKEERQKQVLGIFRLVSAGHWKRNYLLSENTFWLPMS